MRPWRASARSSGTEPGAKSVRVACQNKLIPGCSSPHLYFPRPVHSRASSIAMLDDGAGRGGHILQPWWSTGRRSGLRHWPRAPRKRRPPVTGTIAVGAMADREVRPAGSSPAVQGRRSALAPPGAPSPRRGEKENRDTGSTQGRPKTKPRAAERWLFETLNWKRDIRANESPANWAGLGLLRDAYRRIRNRHTYLAGATFAAKASNGL